MPWLALTVQVDGADSEALGDALLEQGAQSVCIEAAGLTALLAQDADPRAVLAAAGAAALPFRLSRLEDEDWVRRAQAQVEPLALGRLWVGPSWRAAPRGAQAAVRIDPGLAFGTGGHASTRLVLGYLERSVRGGERVLDYGSGSGILAIAAAKLGAATVDAVDLDPVAVATTLANARANDVEVGAFAPEALGDARYDIVVSNILAGPLVLLAPALTARCAPRGRIALAGILDAQADEVAQAYARDFAMTRTAEEGWALLAGVRR